jgi:signal transduction histidine kinase
MLFDRAPPFWIANRENQLLFANRAYRDILGDESAPVRRDAIVRVFDTGDPVSHLESATANGHVRHYRVYMFPIPGHQRPPSAVGGLVHDTTTEVNALALAREQKQRFNDIIRSTSDWVWETDNFGRLAFVSERITEALAVPPALLLGKLLGEIGAFAEADPNGAAGATGAASATGAAMTAHRPFRNAPFTIAAADGKTRHFSLSGVPIFDAAGAFTGYRGTAADVSARIAAETAVRNYQAKLEAALDGLGRSNLELDMALRDAQAAAGAKDAFLSTMSHELRTPLNAIIGFSELMSMGTFGPLNAQYGDYSRHILQAGHRLLTLVDDILDLARLDSRQLPLDLAPVPCNGLLDDVLAAFAARAAEKKITLYRAADNGVTLKADLARARQILANVLDNAVKFTPAGGEIGFDVEMPVANRARISIWDTGPGVPPERQSLLFGRFQQIHDGILTRRHEGIGIGLTLARELARAMGGELELAETSPAGSRFAITLPVA